MALAVDVHGIIPGYDCSVCGFLLDVPYDARPVQRQGCFARAGVICPVCDGVVFVVALIQQQSPIRSKPTRVYFLTCQIFGVYKRAALKVEIPALPCAEQHVPTGDYKLPASRGKAVVICKLESVNTSPCQKVLNLAGFKLEQEGVLFVIGL